jgi:hypothetical protein
MYLSREWNDGTTQAKAEVNIDGISAQVHIAIRQTGESWANSTKYTFSRADGSSARGEILQFAQFVCDKCGLHNFPHTLQQGITDTLAAVQADRELRQSAK